MNRCQFREMEEYMRTCMGDSAHDAEHIYRVLYYAMEIAKGEENVDYDVLITASLLHDIGRMDQFRDPSLCHAQVGAKKAADYLLAQGFSVEFVQRVHHCILTHRFRKENQPQSIEAKILFDADKLDVTGAVGIARTLMYRSEQEEPLYTKRPDGSISDVTGDENPSFCREYKFKLEKLYDRFLTKGGWEMAQSRQKIARDYYESLLREVNEGYGEGRVRLNALLDGAE